MPDAGIAARMEEMRSRLEQLNTILTNTEHSMTVDDSLNDSTPECTSANSTNLATSARPNDTTHTNKDSHGNVNNSANAEEQQNAPPQPPVAPARSAIHDNSRALRHEPDNRGNSPVDYTNRTHRSHGNHNSIDAHAPARRSTSHPTAVAPHGPLQERSLNTWHIVQERLHQKLQRHSWCKTPPPPGKEEDAERVRADARTISAAASAPPAWPSSSLSLQRAAREGNALDGCDDVHAEHSDTPAPSTPNRARERAPDWAKLHMRQEPPPPPQEEEEEEEDGYEPMHDMRHVSQSHHEPHRDNTPEGHESSNCSGNSVYDDDPRYGLVGQKDTRHSHTDTLHDSTTHRPAPHRWHHHLSTLFPLHAEAASRHDERDTDCCTTRMLRHGSPPPAAAAAPPPAGVTGDVPSLAEVTPKRVTKASSIAAGSATPLRGESMETRAYGEERGHTCEGAMGRRPSSATPPRHCIDGGMATIANKQDGTVIGCNIRPSVTNKGKNNTSSASNTNIHTRHHNIYRGNNDGHSSYIYNTHSHNDNTKNSKMTTSVMLADASEAATPRPGTRTRHDAWAQHTQADVTRRHVRFPRGALSTVPDPAVGMPHHTRRPPSPSTARTPSRASTRRLGVRSTPPQPPVRCSPRHTAYTISSAVVSAAPAYSLNQSLSSTAAASARWSTPHKESRAITSARRRSEWVHAGHVMEERFGQRPVASARVHRCHDTMTRRTPNTQHVDYRDGGDGLHAALQHHKQSPSQSESPSQSHDPRPHAPAGPTQHDASTHPTAPLPVHDDAASVLEYLTTPELLAIFRMRQLIVSQGAPPPALVGALAAATDYRHACYLTPLEHGQVLLLRRTLQAMRQRPSHRAHDGTHAASAISSVSSASRARVMEEPSDGAVRQGGGGGVGRSHWSVRRRVGEGELVARAASRQRPQLVRHRLRP